MAGLDSVMPIVSKPHGCTLHKVPKDFEDIQLAIRSAEPNDCIVISSGTYVLNQPLIVDRDLHIMGDDDGVAQGVVFQMDRHAPTLLRQDVHMLSVCTQSARVSNIAFDHTDSSSDTPTPPQELVFCVFIKEGNVIIDRCKLHSTFSSCIGCGTLSRATITRCTFVGLEYGVFCGNDTLTRVRTHNSFTDCKTGVFFDEGSRGCCEENSFDNCSIGVEAAQKSHPDIMKNSISKSAESGIFISGGTEVQEKPQVNANSLIQCQCGIAVAEQGSPQAQKNVIHNCTVGVRVSEHGGGSFLLNEMKRCESAIIVESGGTADFTKNVITETKRDAVTFTGMHTFGMLKDNDVTDNGECGVLISDFATPSILQNNIQNNTGAGIRMQSGGPSVIEQNEIQNNTGNGITIHSSAPEVNNNTIQKNQGRGLYILQGGGGVYTGNHVVSNDRAGVEVDTCPAVPIDNTPKIAGISGPLSNPPPQKNRKPHTPIFPHFTENTINFNNGEGITVYGGSSAKITGNLLKKNTSAPIYWTNDCQVEEDGNITEQN
eukprot:TRINITY_DN94189_c0_g1_i1.p1 TRINITY_DN94189_c0_g1~~TRINITY_DN94189_c0_g1_i1.p1  ORF type:complete len:544 (-),score=44.22 TRINITY_DN94189_c0_g1_i1:574-2205(-)